jgi:hypothetical protein
MNGFQGSLDVLRKDNDALRKQLMLLQRNCGVLFPKFSKLPIQIRRQVNLLLLMRRFQLTTASAESFGNTLAEYHKYTLLMKIRRLV